MNKIIDCITFYDENLITNARFEILKDVVDKFIVCESMFDHSGNPKKINYIYVLTPKGISHKTKLTLNFMKRKMREYDELKSELKKK